MITYEAFFLMILISILGPVVGVVLLIFFNMFEKQVYVLEIEKKQIELEKELERSRYLQLNQQIQPHFLFNALNSMLSLIRLKRYDGLKEAFEHMVLYLRFKYVDKDPLYVMTDEISYTNHFIAIQKLRFGERLQVSWEVDIAVKQALILPYLLQTLVENAFKHGVEMVEGDALIHIEIKKYNKEVSLTVKDNGPGFQDTSFLDHYEGIGLKNIETRLHLLFGETAKLVIQPTVEESGGIVTVIWPFIEEEKDESIGT